MNALAVLTGLQRQVEKLTERERAMLSVLALLAAFWVAASCFTLAGDARRRLSEAQAADIALVPGGLAGDARNARAWAMVDVGDNLAEVRALALVEEAAAQAGLSDVTTRVETGATRGSPPGRIVITMDAAYEKDAFADLIKRLGEADEAVTPVEVDVDAQRRRLRMRIVALHLKTGEAS